MKRIVAALFGLRKGERGLALLMTAYHFLLLVTLYLLKPVRDSLFLSERGAGELPFVFMVTTIAVIPIVALHARAGRRLRLSRLINGVALLLVVNLLVLRWLIGMDQPWVYYLLYVWVSIYAVLVTSQFWLMANAVFTAAEAKRIFVLLSLGAILGSVVGGELTGFLVDYIGVGTENLLLICAALLAGSVVLVNLIRYRSRRREGPSPNAAAEGPPAGLAGVFGTLSRSRHLLLIVGIIALAVVATTVVDYQFKTFASRAYPDEEALTTFMGRFYGRVSLVAFVLQLFLAPRLIRILGVGGALSLLPGALAIGSVGMFLVPGLVAGTLLRGVDQSLKHSVDRTGRELLFVPVDLEKKKRVKVFIDLFVDQGTQGFGGLLLLFFTIVMEMDVQDLSIVVLALLGVWMVLVVLARSSYINQFRATLQEQNREDDDRPETATPSPMSFNEVIDSLRSRSRSQVVRGLERLEGGRGGLPIDLLRELLDHRSAEVRRRTIRLLRHQSVQGLSEAVAVHLEDSDPDVRLEATRYLYRNLDGSRGALLKQGLEHDDRRVRAAAVGLIAKDGGTEERALLTYDLLRDLMAYEGDGAEEARTQVARALGVIDRPERDELLQTLLKDPSPRVVEQAIESAGQAGDRLFVPALIDQLRKKAHRYAAHHALAAYGGRILGTLYDYLIDEEIDERIRQRIPDVLRTEHTQAAIDVLMLSSERVSVPIWHAVVRALSKMRAREKKLRFDRETVHRALRAEARRYGGLGQILYLRERTSASSAQHVGTERLVKARRRSLERIFRLLGLRYNQDDLYNAYRGLVSDETSLRSNAMEFVDNVLEWETKKYLFPLLDDPDGERAAQEAPGLFDLRIDRWDEALGYLLASEDPGLMVEALEAAAVEGTPELRRQIEAAARHANTRVQDEAQRVMAEYFPEAGEDEAGEDEADAETPASPDENGPPDENRSPDEGASGSASASPGQALERQGSST